MPDERKGADPRSAWRNQPVEKLEVSLQHFVRRRALELSTRTRTDIITSIAAALFVLGFMIWRLNAAQDRLQQLGLALVVVWVAVTIYRFRKRIWRSVGLPPELIASTSLDYYRRELQARRDHLRNTWLWQGPLLLALVLLCIILFGKAMPQPGRLLNVLPFLIMLAVWVAFGIAARRHQDRELQREIEEIEQL